MRLRKVMEQPRRISALSAPRASGPVPYSRLVTDKSENFERSDSGLPSTDEAAGVNSLVRIESEVLTTEEVSYGNSGASR